MGGEEGTRAGVHTFGEKCRPSRFFGQVTEGWDKVD
jgi:hypothetical protein